MLLTFDDGPDSTWTPRVLDALAAAGTRAAFFVLGARAAAHPELVVRILAEGHAVELHGWAHLRHPRVERYEVEADAERGLAVLDPLGARPGRWRTPWGQHAPWTADVAAALGLELAGWTLDPHDWRGDCAAAMLAQCRRGLDRDAIVLLHDGLGPGARRGGCAETVALIPRLAAAWRALEGRRSAA